jgi:hypothetical protein
MKIFNKSVVSLTILVLIMLMMKPEAGQAQVVNSSAKKRISIGVGLLTDIWMNQPTGMKTRTINQGVQLFGTYNTQFGKSNFSFAIGLGITIHNMYWNYRFQGDSLKFQFVPLAGTSYKRSKVTMPYFEVPIEFRLKTKSKISAGIGFKIGYMVYSHTKYVGSDYLYKTNNTLKVSFKGVKNLENFAYGPTVRLGYKWFNLTGYYSLSSVFQKATGYDIYPISIGFVLMPF